MSEAGRDQANDSATSSQVDFKNFQVLIAGFHEDWEQVAKEQLADSIKRLGGRVRKKLTKTVTHVVTSTAFDEDCLDAVHKFGIPIMSRNWIDIHLERQQTGTFPMVRATGVCPLFYNVRVALTRMNDETKRELKSLVESNRGCVSTGMLSKDRVDILVLEEPSGTKFEKAQRWGVDCVKPGWILESIKRGRLLRTEQFLWTKKSNQDPKHNPSGNLKRPNETS